MLLAVPYFLAANYCTILIEDGGPGWLHLLVLLFCWNALKPVIVGPLSAVLLIRARSHEAKTRRHARRAGLHPDASDPRARYASNVR